MVSNLRMAVGVVSGMTSSGGAMTLCFDSYVEKYNPQGRSLACCRCPYLAGSCLSSSKSPNKWLQIGRTSDTLIHIDSKWFLSSSSSWAWTSPACGGCRSSCNKTASNLVAEQASKQTNKPTLTETTSSTSLI